MESYKQKQGVYTRDNHKLQEELSEVYRIKGQFADLLKVETDKNLELEKEVKFFQGKVAAALLERDHALVQSERSHEKEQALMMKMNELRDRLDHITSDCLKQKRHCRDLQKDLEGKEEEREMFREVVDLFWKIRCNMHGFDNAEGPQDKARILLTESENAWVYGDTNKTLADACSQAEKAEATMAELQEDFHAAVASVASLQRQLEEECLSHRQTEERASLYKEKLLLLAAVIGTEMKMIQSTNISLKEDLLSMVKEENKMVSSLSETFQDIFNGAKISLDTNKKSGVVKMQAEEFSDEDRGAMEPADKTRALCSESSCKDIHADREYSSRQADDLQFDDSKAVFAQALQEKVAALLLLSQQEERHILEKTTSIAWEYQISELNQRLSQVTSEKVKALMDLASLREQFQKFQEQERRRMTSGRYLTYWLGGLNFVGSKPSGRACVSTEKKEDALAIARWGPV